MLRKALVTLTLFVFILVSFLSVFPTSTKAQSPTPTPGSGGGFVNPWYKQSYEEWVVKVDDETNQEEIFGERYTAAQVQWVVYGLAYMLYNFSGDSDTFTCVLRHVWEGGDSVVLNCTSAIAETILKYSRQSTTSYSPFTKPLATSDYVRYVQDRLHLAPDANAQGFGFTAANPVLQLWIASRNMSYVLMVLVIILMAFMIMFRVKLSPQTVITVQSALPRIVITLILITFSYAIGGLLIDLMYVVVGLIAALFTGSGLTSDTGALATWADMFEWLTQPILWHLLWYFVQFMIALIVSLPGLIAVFGIVGGALLTGGLIGWLALIVIGLFLLFFIWKAIKITFVIIKAYVMTVLLIAFSPFMLLVGAFGQGGFGNWVKQLASHLAVFPVVGVMLFLANYFLIASMSDRLQSIINGPGGPNFVASFGQSGWSPPLTFGGATAGQGELGTNILYLLVSFSILMLIPKVTDIIKSVITGREFAYGSAIGAEAAMITGAAAGVSRMGAGAGVLYGAEGLSGGSAATRLGRLGNRFGLSTGRRQRAVDAIGRWGGSGFRKW